MNPFLQLKKIHITHHNGEQYKFKSLEIYVLCFCGIYVISCMCFIYNNCIAEANVTEVSVMLSSTPSSPIPTQPSAGSCSLSSDELTFWYCSRDLLKTARASWKSTQGFLESSWLHSEAERKCLPSFSWWLRWGWKFLSIKRRWIILNFMCNFHPSNLWKSLFLCLLQTKKNLKWTYFVQVINTNVRNAAICIVCPVSYSPDCTISCLSWNFTELN